MNHPPQPCPRSGSIARSRTPVAVCEIAEFGRGHRAGSLSVPGVPRGGKAADRKRSSSPESELCFPRASGKRGGGVACPLCAPECGSTHPGSHVSESRAPFGGARRPPEVRETQTAMAKFRREFTLSSPRVTPRAAPAAASARVRPGGVPVARGACRACGARGLVGSGVGIRGGRRSSRDGCPHRIPATGSGRWRCQACSSARTRERRPTRPPRIAPRSAHHPNRGPGRSHR